MNRLTENITVNIRYTKQYDNGINKKKIIINAINNSENEHIGWNGKLKFYLIEIMNVTISQMITKFYKVQNGKTNLK